MLQKKAIVAAQIKREWWDINLENSNKNLTPMNKMNRDLLVLFNQELLSPQAIEHEVELLHDLLYSVERLDNLVTAHEVIDLNKYKVINKALVVRNTIREQELKQFVFLNCKN